MASDIVSKIAATEINTRSVSDSRGLKKLVQYWEETIPLVTLVKLKLAGG